MLFALIGIVIGMIAGWFVPFEFSAQYSLYTAVAILAGLDSLLGAARAQIQNRFDSLLFATGFVSNALLAALVAYLGDRLGVPLYYAPIFFFGSRLFYNFSAIRILLLDKWRAYAKNKTQKTDT